MSNGSIQKTMKAIREISEHPRHRRLTVLDAPSNLGLKAFSTGEPGVKHMASVLRAHGLLERLCAEDGGAVIPPAYAGAMDPVIKVRNAKGIREYSGQLADRIGDLLGENRFPIVLGGDCSILLGIALALRRRGLHGLLFLDGHTDLLTPADSETGGVAGMDLAIATGTGPKLLTDIEGKEPYLQSEDVVVFGYRWPVPGDSSLATPREPMVAFPITLVREQGIAHSARSAVAYLEAASKSGFWVHLDLDALAPEWMPAVDSPDPGGMSPEELSTTLRTAFESERCLGVHVTIYDPTLDPGEHRAELVLDLLVQSLQSRQ
jgi:arginase